MLSGIWLLNETLESIPYGRLLNFTCNGVEFKGFGGMSGWTGCLCYFTTTNLNNDLQFAYDNYTANSEEYRVINIADGQEDADLLAWLEVNAVRHYELMFKEKMDALNDNINNLIGTSGKHTIDGMNENIVNYQAPTTLKAYLDITKSLYRAFYQNATITDLTGLIAYSDTENVEDMMYAFSDCTKLTTVPLINTSNVKTMYAMFQNCSNLETIPLLDMSNLEEEGVRDLFCRCNNLKSIPYTYLNLSNVHEATQMFAYCYELLDVPRIDLMKHTSTNYLLRLGNMFSGCYKITKVDINYFFSSTSYNQGMCMNCYSLKTIIFREFGTVYTLNSMAFYNCYHLDGTVNETYNPNGDKDCYIYVPSAMVDTLKSATNWSTYADQIRALEDYTVDGTTTGELDESKI